MSPPPSRPPDGLPPNGPARWWQAQAHQERRPALRLRGRIAAGIRNTFDALDFIEVETAALQVSPGNETHLHAFATALHGPDRSALPFYLRTSPEFACKKLMAAGERRIYEFARVFRNRERGALHHPEFTMLEWYRAQEPIEALMADCAMLLARAAAISGLKQWSYRGRLMDPIAAPERVSVAEAFRRHAGIDLLATIPDADALATEARRIGIRTADDDTWGDVFSRILVEKIEPHLGLGRATILHDYPAIQSALARASATDPRVAERFELYACGVELANGFGELTDSVEQRRRLTQEMAEKERIYGERYPLDEDFLAALAAMPPTSGIALGFDRLVMLAAGVPRIDQVMWTPLPEA